MTNAGSHAEAWASEPDSLVAAGGPAGSSEVMLSQLVAPWRSGAKRNNGQANIGRGNSCHGFAGGIDRPA